MNSLINFLKYLQEHAAAILIGIVAALLLALIISLRSCNTEKSNNVSLNKSIEAIYDSISYYKTKNNNLVAEKKLLEGDISLLKTTNKELYDKIQEMNQKKADRVIYVESSIENPKDSTTWDLEHNDSLPNLIETKYFDFSNKWRTLQGYVTHTNNNLGLNITKDEVFFDYTLVMKDNEVFVTSNNPYVKYNEITGIIIPKAITQKPKRWHIGPSVTVGYDIIHRKWALTPGVSVTYSILSF